MRQPGSVQLLDESVTGSGVLPALVEPMRVGAMQPAADDDDARALAAAQRSTASTSRVPVPRPRAVEDTDRTSNWQYDAVLS